MNKAPTAILLFLLLPAALAAQPATFTNLHNFTFVSLAGTNSDGANPYSGLLIVSNYLYGEANNAGSNASGTIFRLSTAGTNFATLHHFSAMYYNPALQIASNPDGGNPEGDLVTAGGVLYGTTHFGGSGGSGTLFQINPDGTGFTNFHTFTAPVYDLVDNLYTNGDGASPSAGLLVVSNQLFGTTFGGGFGSVGVVFSVNANGSNFTTLHSFAPTVFDNNVSVNFYTNTDGAYPYGSLTVVSNALYGTTYQGGSGGAGVIFRINLDGSGFTNLHNFSPLKYNGGGSNYTNRDGGNSYARLVSGDGALYGTTYYGGTNGNGTIFKINSDGSGFTNLYEFTFGDDGANPEAGLTATGSVLYGTGENGGATGNGTVYQINTDGSGFKTLHGFSDLIQNPVTTSETNSDGASPYGDLIMAGGILYGTTVLGGTGGGGTVFALTPPSAFPLTIRLSGTNAVLMWSGTGLRLQSALYVTGAYTAITGAISPYTNSISSSQQFFRLSTN